MVYIIIVMTLKYKGKKAIDSNKTKAHDKINHEQKARYRRFMINNRTVAHVARIAEVLDR